MVGIYIGINETKKYEVILSLNVDNLFKMDLFADADFENNPQETLVGIWKKKGNQLKLITEDNEITYEQISENFIMKSFKLFSLEKFRRN